MRTALLVALVLVFLVAPFALAGDITVIQPGLPPIVGKMDGQGNIELYTSHGLGWGLLDRQGNIELNIPNGMAWGQVDRKGNIELSTPNGTGYGQLDRQGNMIIYLSPQRSGIEPSGPAP